LGFSSRFSPSPPSSVDNSCSSQQQQAAKPAAAAAPKPAAPAAAKPAAGPDFKCVICATTKKGEEDCSETGDNLNKYQKTCPKLNEGAFKGATSIGCRKILQRIGDEREVIRECAYSGENVHAQRKTGNSGIQLFYYQCSDNEGKPCNSVSSFSIFTSLLLAFAARFLA
ncbi:hypothetical protein PFISCL1PPCAC_24309, partial [Pristionchus fissidentatus]